MAFKNEYIPPLEQEISEFLKNARETLRTGYSKYDAWTVDRERDMVLFRRGGGHSMESKDEDYWNFIDRKGKYYICTTLLSKSETAPEELAITRSFHHMTGGGDSVPHIETLGCIKEALSEYKDWGVISDYKRCQLTLIDVITGKEI